MWLCGDRRRELASQPVVTDDVRVPLCVCGCLGLQTLSRLPQFPPQPALPNIVTTSCRLYR